MKILIINGGGTCFACNQLKTMVEDIENKVDKLYNIENEKDLNNSIELGVKKLPTLIVGGDIITDLNKIKKELEK